MTAPPGVASSAVGDASEPRRGSYTGDMQMSGLPGADLVEQGLRDLTGQRETDAAWLVLIGAPRLRSLGVEVPEAPASWFANEPDRSPEHRLYLRLARTDGDSAHSRYNALVRRLVSFERAAACAG